MKVAFTGTREGMSWQQRESLDRNLRLVAECDVLVAAPLTDAEVRRSGTWATVRYARRRGVPVVMLARGE